MGPTTMSSASVARRAGQAANGIERRLHQLERGLARSRDEHGIGAPEVALGPERQAVPEAHERLAAERQVELGDPEAVQARDDRKHAAGLGGQLGTDAVPRETRDRVPPAHGELNSMVPVARTCTPLLTGSHDSGHTSPLASSTSAASAAA
jgi:hypothetical protein